MILLDTDHLSMLKYEENPRCVRLRERLELASGFDPVATTIVSVEEQMRGWLARIHRERDPHKQIACYEMLGGLLDFYATWQVVQFDSQAAAEFVRLRHLRMGAHDLKIACIALTHDPVLLSANLRDFSRVPRLRVEDWLAS